jgi:hypothetical protein
MASTANTDRSLFREVLDWALPELVGYVLAALGAVVAFSIWAVVYTYVWPGKPPISIETPPPIPAKELTPPAVFDPPLVAQLPGDRIPEGLPIAQARKLFVYTPSSEKVGQIEDVLVGNGGKVTFYIVSVGEWFPDASKDIAVPSQKVTWAKRQSSLTKQWEWMPVVSMTKADAKNAPKQIFDPSTKQWKQWLQDPAR